MNTDEIIAKAGIDLAAAAIKNTASIAHDRVGAAKAKNRAEDQNAELQEIISDLLADKAELLRIAQIYEQELSSQKITGEDIEFITKNIFPIILSSISDERQTKDLNKIKGLLSKETFTILQLFGFNYKRAIGEPLTNLVRTAIESKIPNQPRREIDQNQVTLAMLDLAKDEKAFGRFREIVSWGGNDEK